MDSKLLLWAAIGLGIAGLAVGMTALMDVESAGDQVSSDIDVAALNRRLDAIESRLADSEASIQSMRRSHRTVLPVAAAGRVADREPAAKAAASTPESSAREARLAEMLDRFDRYEKRMRGERDRLRQVALNKEVDVRQRRDAIEQLREMGFGFGDLDDDIIKGIFDGLADVPGGRDRGQLIKAMIGVTNPAMIEPLTKVARHDPEDDAREEAIDALEPFAHLPEVRRTLEAAAEQDEHHKVRRHAQRILDRLQQAR